MIIENTSFGYAFNHSFRLIKDNWWATFGIMVVIAIIISVASMVVVLPAALINIGSIFLHFTRGTTVSVTAAIVSTFLKEISHIFNILTIVATAVIYFNLTETKEGTGMLERINQFGKANPNTDITPEEY
jgi:predicted RND superfamily exporter protein